MKTEEQIKKVLGEVKNIAKGVRSYLKVPAPRDVRFEMDRILDLITKVQESEIWKWALVLQKMENH